MKYVLESEIEPAIERPLRIYVAGPMRGYKDFNFPAFDAKRDEINALGHVAVSPADLDREAGDVDEKAGVAPPIEVCMHRDIAALLECDAIAFLDGWEYSEGALNEQTVGRILGLKFYYPEDEIPPVVDAPEQEVKIPEQVVKGQGEVRVTSETGGQKGSKPAQLGAVDPAAIMEVATVAGFGAMKYDAYNYTKGYDWSLSYNALQRHLHAFWAGEDTDPESGLPHLAHAAWHCLALITFLRNGVGTDDRFPLLVSS
jgi:hypothetical protein